MSISATRTLVPSQGNTHLYYNVVMQNTSQAVALPAKFSEERAAPILNNPSLWEMSVVRFKIPTDNIPLFIFPSPTGPYMVGFVFQDQLFASNLLMTTGMDNDPNSDTYGFVYDYQPFVDSLNDAMKTAFDVLKGAFPAEFGTTNSPYMLFSPESGLFSLVAEQGKFQPDVDDTKGAAIVMNEILYKFYQNLPAKQMQNGAFSVLFGERTFWVLVKNNGNNEGKVGTTAIAGYACPDPWGGTGYDVWIMQQEVGSLGMWAHAESIVLTSGGMPIANEMTPSTGGGAGNIPSLQTESTGANNQTPIISDFELTKDRRGPDEAWAQYVPTGPYRMIDMKNQTPLTKIDVSIYWQDRSLALRPLLISPSSYASLKIMFRRKGTVGS